MTRLVAKNLINISLLLLPFACTPHLAATTAPDEQAAAPAAETQGPVHRYDLKTVTVANSLVVREHPLGIVFQQTYAADAECKLDADQTSPEARPIAARAGSQIDLQMDFMSCVENAAPPTARCSWTIVEHTPLDANAPKRSRGATVDITGYKGTVPVQIPNTTGVYTLQTTCAMEAGEEHHRPYFERRLYVTYLDPRPSVAPAKRDWFAKAAEWGAGFPSSATEEELLEGMLGRIYEYGQRRWKYGLLPDAYDLSDPYLPICNDIAGRWCVCGWEALIDDNSTCDFGDCYRFSAVFEAMAATQGIGVFEAVVIAGENNAGFLTPPDAVSVDPNFRRSIICDPSDPDGCPAYIFGTHSLRGRDGRFYDTTFNKIYDSLADPVFKSILVRKEPVITLVDTGDILIPAPPGYGAWGYYRYETHDPSRSPMQALTFPVAKEIEFDAPRYYQIPDVVDHGHDAIQTACEPGHTEANLIQGLPAYRFRALAADVGFQLHTDRDIVIQAVLTKNGRMISNRPTAQRPALTSETVSGGGRHCRRFVFSGEQIYRSGEDGPYQLQVSAYFADTGDKVGERDWATKTVLHQLYGQSKANLDGVAADGFDGSGAAPRAVVRMRANDSGSYVLDARLSRNGKTLVYGSQTEYFEAGMDVRTVDVTFDAALVNQALTTGGLELSVELLDGHTRSHGTQQCWIGAAPPDSNRSLSPCANPPAASTTEDQP